MQKPARQKLLNLNEAAGYLRLILLLMQNKSEFARAFYLPQANLTRSFYAYFWCLPAQLFMWSANLESFFIANPDSDISKVPFLIQANLFDAFVWIVLAITIAIAAILILKKPNFTPLIVATNWFNLFVTYVFFIPTTLVYFLPITEDVGVLLKLITYLMLIGLYFRLIRQVSGGNKPFAFALTLLNVVLGLFMTQLAFSTLYS
jgi:hypothetical protein